MFNNHGLFGKGLGQGFYSPYTLEVIGIAEYAATPGHRSTWVLLDRSSPRTKCAMRQAGSPLT